MGLVWDLTIVGKVAGDVSTVWLVRKRLCFCDGNVFIGLPNITVTIPRKHF